MRVIFTIILLMTFASMQAQKVNFLTLSKYRVSTLADVLRENSGLTFYDGKLYTLNDGGNAADIFVIDPFTGKVETIINSPFKNSDWEAIATDSTHLYIGDFGNNAGSRTDLKLLKIPHDKSQSAGSTQTIGFYYPEQTDFRSRLHNNDFDAEAMVFLNANLHIFTKGWTSGSTTHYLVDPAIYEGQAAQKVSRYKTGFLVTDAAYYNKRLYLVGYTKKAEVFLSIFTESRPGIFFENEPQKYYLGTAFSVGQVEGVEVNDQGIYISSEAFRTPLGVVKQGLYFVPHSKIKAGK